jgi:hypothetical protein
LPRLPVARLGSAACVHDMAPILHANAMLNAQVREMTMIAMA